MKFSPSILFFAFCLYIAVDLNAAQNGTTMKPTTTKSTMKPSTTTTTMKPTTTSRIATSTTSKSSSKPTTTPVKLSTLITTTTIKPIITTPSTIKSFKICGDTNSSDSVGSIQPLDGLTYNEDTEWPMRRCTFTIVAPADQHIQMSCSVANLTKITTFSSSDYNFYYSSLTFLETLNLNPYDNVILPNRVYTSYGNRMTVTYQVVNTLDTFDCKWTTIKAPTTATDFKWCRDGETIAANGTIQSLYDSSTTSANGSNALFEKAIICPFFINSSPNSQIQTSCSPNSSFSSFQLTTFDTLYDKLQLRLRFNRTTSNRNRVELLFSVAFSIADTAGSPVVCNWTTTTPSTTTRDFNQCLHVQSTTKNGIITPLAYRTDSKFCLFSVIAPMDQRIQISCSAVPSNGTNAIIEISGITEISSAIILNRVYTSISNRIDVMTSFFGSGDWFQCNWTTITLPTPTKDFKLCQDGETTASSGTIQPFGNATAPALENPARLCRFTITAPSNKHVRLSCPVITANTSAALYEFDPLGQFHSSGNTFTSLLIIASPPVVNTVYTSKKNEMNLLSLINGFSWFNCIWTFV